MSKQYDNTNRGVLFSNRDKEQPNHPDFKGNINIDGKEYWLSCWTKNTKNGDPMFSLSVKAKDPTKTVASALKQVRQGGHAPSSVDDFNDEIPF